MASVGLPQTGVFTEAESKSVQAEVVKFADRQRDAVAAWSREREATDSPR